MTQEPGSILTEKIIGIAISVHRKLGPGLLESVYSQCLSHSLQKNGLRTDRQVPLPLIFDGFHLTKPIRPTLLSRTPCCSNSNPSGTSCQSMNSRPAPI